MVILAMDWMMKKTRADKRRGIQWNLRTVLEDLDFADDIALFSYKFNDLLSLTEETARVGLKLYAGEKVQDTED